MKNHFDADQIESPLYDIEEHRGHTYFDQLKKKIRWRLLLVYVTPLTVLAVFFYYQYHVTLRQGIDNHLKSIAENQRNTVDLFLKERVANLRNAFQLNSLSLLNSPKEIERTLRTLRRESETFVDLGLFRPDGTLVSYAGPYPSLVGRQYASEQWFQQLRKDNAEFFISDVYLGFRGKPHFIVAVRQIVEGDRWTLRASVDPKKFGEFVGSSYLVQGAEAFIVNRKGKRQTFTSQSDAIEHDVGVLKHTSDTHITEIELVETTFLRALAWLTENDWVLIVQVPKSKAYGPIWQARIVLAGIIITALILIVLVVESDTRHLVGMLERADRAKDDLRHQLFNAAKLASVGEIAAGVAHEINNPLAIIYEEAAMMKDLLDPQFGQVFDREDFNERLDEIKKATLRGRTITRKLLTFARQHEPSPEPVDINLLLESVIKTREDNFKLSNITIVRRFQSRIPPVTANTNELEQVILNLLNNAKDAIGDNGTITLCTRTCDDQTLIEVEDTGCGMSQEVMANVFFPFYTTKGVGKGTGLGLSISYGIIKSLGGRIKVKSQVDFGTTITLRLPIVEKQNKMDIADT